MCYRREETAHCVNDKPQRGTRTLHCHADIHSPVELAAKDMANPVVLSQEAANTHALVGFEALVRVL